MWTDLDESNAAGHCESVAEDHLSGEHEDKPRACCWLCQEEVEE